MDKFQNLGKDKGFRKRIMDAYKKLAEEKKLTDKELRDRILAPYIKESK